MKTPEEIKNGLACCDEASGEECYHCPYMIDCETFDNAGNLSRDALAYITQLEARVPKWISVKDKLPEYYKDLLVIVREGGAVLYMIAHLCIGGIMVSNSGERINGVVTHWMPLPDMTKEDEQHE